MNNPDLSRFTTVRSDLRLLVGRVSKEKTVPLLAVLQTSLHELGKLRKKLFSSKPKPLKIIDVVAVEIPTLDPKVSTPTIRLEPVRRHVSVRTPTLSEIPRPSTHTRRVPTSTTYNAERYLPYRILWAKVIIRATYDYALWKDSKDMRLKKFAREAETWLFESSDLELSFENICFTYDFPVEKIRQRTRLLTKNDVKKLEFRERQGRGDPTLGEAGGNHR